MQNTVAATKTSFSARRCTMWFVLGECHTPIRLVTSSVRIDAVAIIVDINQYAVLFDYSCVLSMANSTCESSAPASFIPLLKL